MSHVAQKMSHVVSKKEPSGTSPFCISAGTIPSGNKNRPYGRVNMSADIKRGEIK
jgi:hypothetical protein